MSAARSPAPHRHRHGWQRPLGHARFLPRVAGHKKGVDALRACVRHCGDIGVKVLTVFAFSSENWNRPAEEVSGLMELLALALSREVPQLQSEGVRIHFIGDRAGLSEKVRNGLEQAEAATAGNSRLVFNICFNYGGRWDIAQAAASWPRAAKPSPSQPGPRHGAGPRARSRPVDPHRRRAAHQQLPALAGRVQRAVFHDKLWPEFDAAAIDAAIADYAGANAASAAPPSKSPPAGAKKRKAA
jgi:undecaprenyl diphosphate synthase